MLFMCLRQHLDGGRSRERIKSRVLKIRRLLLSDVTRADSPLVLLVLSSHAAEVEQTRDNTHTRARARTRTHSALGAWSLYLIQITQFRADNCTSLPGAMTMMCDK